MTQRELAEAAEIGKRSVEDYERSGTVPRKALPQLARALGVSPHFLLTGTDTVEDKIDRLVEEVARVVERQSQLEQLLAQAAGANRRIWYSLDATLRLVLAQIAPDEVLARLPDPPRLDGESGSTAHSVRVDPVEEDVDVDVVVREADLVE